MYNPNPPYGADCPTGCPIIPDPAACGNEPLVDLPQYKWCNGKTEFTVEDILCDLCQDWLPIFQWSCRMKRFAQIPAFGMDIKEVTDTKMLMQGIKKILTIKSDSPVVATLTQDGTGVHFGEHEKTFPEAIVSADVTSSKTVTVDSAKRFFVNDYLKFFTEDPKNPCCTLEIRRKVTAVNYATQTVTLDSEITVDEWVRVVKLYNDLQNCTLPQANAALDSTKYFKSYFQNFGGGFSFSFAEANKCYSTNDGAMMFAKAKMMASLEDVLRQVHAAKWFALNVPEIKPTQASQTMGLIPTIQYVRDNYGIENHFDLRGTRTDFAKVVKLKKIFEQAQKCMISGANGDLIVATTYSFYEALSLLNGAWMKVKGCIPMAACDTPIAFEVKEIQSLYGKIKFYVDPYLDWHYDGRSIAVYFPDHQHVIWTPKNKGLNENMTMDPYSIDTIPLTELKNQNEGKVNCDREFVYSFTLAFIVAGARTGSIGIIEWLDVNGSL